MRVGNRMALAIGRAKAMQEAKHSALAKARKSTVRQTNSRTRLSTKKNETSDKNSTAINQRKKAASKSTYESISNAATNVKGDLLNLTSTKEDSLFALASNTEEKYQKSEKLYKENPTESNKKAMEEDKAAATAARAKLTDEISSFAEDYNKMMTAMDGVEDNDALLYRKQMKYCFEKNSAALQKIGITVSSNGLLSVNEDTLNRADLSKVKNLFQRNYSLGSTMTQATKNILDYAETEMKALDETSYLTSSNYDKYGTATAASGGTRYNTRG